MATTDASGNYEFLNLSLGTYKATASASGYNDFADPVEIKLETGSLTVIRNFVLSAQAAQLGGLKVTVKEDISGIPTEVANASVSITSGEYTTDRYTGTDGTVTFAAIPIGTYSITVSKTGYSSETNAGTVTVGQTEAVAVELIKTPEVTGLIKGNVTDEAGIPVSGITLRLIPDDEDIAEKNAITDVSGNYWFRSVPLGGYTISVEANNYVPQSRSTALSQSSEDLTAVEDFIIKKIATQVTGQISSVNGPLVSAVVTFTHEDTTTYTALTNDSGNYTITTLPLGKYTVKAAKSGYMDSAAGQIELTASKTTETWSTMLNPETTATGILEGVVTKAGTDPAEPIEGAVITSNLGTVYTDGNGKYSYGAVPAGSYELTVNAEGYVESIRGSVVNGNETTKTDFVLQALPVIKAVVRGTVRDSSGRLLDGVDIKLRNDNTGATETETTSSGVFRIPDVVQGSYTLTASLAGYQTEVEYVDIDSNNTVTVDMILSNSIESGSLEGTVFDDSGNTVAGVTVSLENDYGVKVSRITNGIGEYKFSGLQAGYYILTATAESYSSHNEGIEINRDITGKDITLQHYTIPVYTISGYIYSSLDGNEIADAIISIEGNGIMTAVNSQSDGSYKFTNLEAGTYQVTVEKSGFVTQSVEIHVSTDRTNQNFTLSPPKGSLTVTLHDELSGTAISGATVSLYLIGESEPVQERNTNYNGIVQFSDLVMGEYKIVVTKIGYYEASEQIGFYETEELSQQVAMETTSIKGAIVGYLIDEENNPVAGAKIVLSTTRGVEINEYTSNNNGEFYIYDLEMGTYLLTVTHDLYDRATEQVTLDSDYAEVRLTLIETEEYSGTIAGMILDKATNRGLEGVDVYAKNITTNVSADVVQTNDSGDFRITGLANGTYRVTFVKDGYITLYDEFVVDADEGVGYTTLVMSRAVGSISGSVFADYIAVEGAYVEIECIEDGQLYSRSTGSNGQYEVDNLPAGHYNITIKKAGYQNFEESVQITEVNLHLSRVHHLSAEGAAISGRVTSLGRAVNDVSVKITGLGTIYFEGEVFTDSTGYFYIAGLEEGTYWLTFSKSGYYDYDTSSSITMGVNRINAELEERTGGIGGGIEFSNFNGQAYTAPAMNTLARSGNFTTAADELPTVHITVYNSYGNVVATTTTDESGRFFIEQLPYGDYTVVLRTAGYKTITREVTIDDLNPIIYLDNLKFEPLSGQVTLTFTVKDGENSAPLNDAVIRVGDEFAVANGNGKYEIVLHPEYYSVLATLDGYESASFQLWVTGEHDIQEVDIALLKSDNPATAGIVAIYTVLESDNNVAIFDAAVKLTNVADPSDFVELTTDNSGAAFFIGLDIGSSYRVSVSKDGYATPAGLTITQSDFAAGSNLVVMKVAMKLEQATLHEVTIIVQDDSTPAKPIDGAKVTLSGTPQVTSNGLAKFTNIPAGAYSIAVTADGYKTVNTNATIPSNSNRLIITLERQATHEVNVHVVDSDNNNLEGAVVTVDGGQSKTTGSNGQAVYDSIIQGRHAFAASLDGYDSKTETVTITGQTTVTITLTKSSDGNGGDNGNGGNGNGNGGGTGGGGGGGGSSTGGGSGAGTGSAGTGTDAFSRPSLEKEIHVVYIEGFADGTVRPEANITRAEAAMILYRVTKDDNKSSAIANDFSDVPDGAWYYQAVSYLAAKGVITGYPDGTFAPNKTITRAEFVTMISRYVELSAGTNLFHDVSGSHWALSYINSAVAKGWITGYSDMTFRPENAITRAETVAIVNRMLERRVDISGIPSGTNQFTDLDATHWAYTHIMEASTEHSYTWNNGYEVWEIKK